MSSKELVISQDRHETKVAILEDGQLVEMFFQRANEYSLAGSIHKGRVTRVLPGMQSAFVDLGLERDCFLYVSDFFEEHADEFDRVDERGRETRGRDRDRSREPRESREASPVLALPPVASGERKVEEFVPVAAAQAQEAGTAPAAAPADDAASVPVEGSADAHRDRRGRRSRRRRRGSRGFPESKYASPTDESAAPAQPEGDVEGNADAEVEAAPQEESRAPEVTALPSEEFQVLPGESLAKYRRHAPSAAAAPAVSARHEVVEPEPEPEPLAEDEADADDAAEAILERVDEMEERADAAAAPQSESDESSSAVQGEEAEAEVAEEAKPEAVAEDKPAAKTAVPESTGESASASLVAELPVSELKAEKPAKASSPAPEEAPAVPSTELEAAAPVAEEQPEAIPVEVSEAEVSTAAFDVEVEETEPDTPEAEESEGEVADQESVEPEGEGPAEGVETAPSSEEGDSAAGPRTPAGRAAHRMSRRMRRKVRQQNQAPASAVADAPSEAAVESGAPVLEAEATEAERTVERPERNGRDRDNRGRDRSREQDRDREKDHDRERPPLPLISDLLKEGQEIIVQIAKEPLGQKGARITSHIALPGRYVVYMPTVEHLGVSRKIGSDEERLRLKKILQKHREGIAGGFIMRTAGEGRSEDEIAADIQYLANLWLDIKQKAEKRRAPLLLHHDVEVVQRLLRDQLTDGFKAVWVDNEDLYEQVLHAVERIAPQMLARVKLYTRPEPIFDAFGITQELEKALRPKVWLKSGGHIVINQTEALVAIDVNTGKYVGKSNRLEDTIVKTNTEAVKEIVRQMRLRDLGGIIVVDFIDMDERKNRAKVMAALEEAMRSDKAPYKILQFNDFGLVAITRKRVKQSLERALCSHCPYCDGAGYVKSVPTVIGEILVEAQKYAKVVDGKECVLRANPEVAKEMKSVENKYLEEIEEILGRPVLVVADPLLHQEKFDLT